MFAAWNLTRAGNGKRSTPADTWESQVHLDLRFLDDLQLDAPKEVYREKLEEHYSNQDLCDYYLNSLLPTPPYMTLIDAHTFKNDGPQK